MACVVHSNDVHKHTYSHTASTQVDNAKLGDQLLLDDTALAIAETMLMPYYRDEHTKVGCVAADLRSFKVRMQVMCMSSLAR